MSISIAATNSTPRDSKWSPAFPQKPSPLNLEDIPVRKSHIHQGAWMKVKKCSLKLKLKTVETVDKWKFKYSQAPYFFSPSTLAPNSLSSPLTVTSYPFCLWSEMRVLCPSQILEALNAQCDGVWRWSLWERIRIRWAHEGGAPMLRVVFL